MPEESDYDLEYQLHHVSKMAYYFFEEAEKANKEIEKLTNWIAKLLGTVTRC